MKILTLSSSFFFLLVLISGPMFAIQTTLNGTNRILSEDFNPKTIITFTENYLFFDGINDYVSINNNLTGQMHQMVMQIKLPFNDDMATFLAPPNINKGDITAFVSGEVISIVGPGGSTNITYNTTPYPDNVFFELKIVWNGSHYDIYYDNVIQNVFTTGSHSPIINLNDFTRLFNRTNNSLYVEGSLRYFSLSDANGKVLEYLIDEGSGTTLNDNIGNNNGTIVGATWNSSPSEQLVIQRSYYQIMENARLANYEDVDGFTNALYLLPQLATSATQAYYNFINWRDTTLDTIDEFLRPTNIFIEEQVQGTFIERWALRVQRWLYGDDE